MVFSRMAGTQLKRMLCLVDACFGDWTLQIRPS